MNLTHILKPLEQAALLAEFLFHNTSAERGLMACLIARPDWIATAAQKVPAEWMRQPLFGNLYRLLLKMYWHACEHHLPLALDENSVAQAAQASGANISEILDAHRAAVALLRDPSVPYDPEAAVARCVEDLRNAALCIGSLKRAHQLQVDLITSQPESAPQAIAQAQNDLLQLTTGLSTTTQVQQVGGAELDLSGNHSIGLRPSPFPMLADTLRGLRNGTLSVVCAKTGCGKSTLLLSLGLDAAVTQRVPTLILDTEMTRGEVEYRAVSALAQVDENFIHTGGCARDARAAEKVQQAHAALKAAPLSHVNVAGLPIEQVLDVMRSFRRLYAPQGPALILFDYLKLPSLDAKHAEWQVLGDMATRLKNASLELNLPIVAGCQANRSALQMQQAEYANEGENIIGGSARIAHLADALLLLRDVTPEEGRRIGQRLGATRVADDDANRISFNQVLHVSKNRGGPSVRSGIPLYFFRGQSRYQEMAYQVNDQGQVIRDDKGRPCRTPELEYLHSPEFAKRSRTGGTNGWLAGVDEMKKSA